MTSDDPAGDAPATPNAAPERIMKDIPPEIAPPSAVEPGNNDRSPKAAASAAEAPATEPPQPKIPILESVTNATSLIPLLTSETSKGTLNEPQTPSSTAVDEPDLSKVRVGDILDSAVVEFIHGQRVDYIVYEFEGRLAYQAHDSVPYQLLATDRSDELMARSELVLKGAYSSAIKKLMAMALVRAFAANSEDCARKAFKSVEDFVDQNMPVGTVFGRTRDFIIFLDKNGELIADCRHLEDSRVPIVAEFERLKQLAAANLDGEDAAAVKRILGHEISSALRSTSATVVPSDAFAASREFIGQRLGADVSNGYVFATLIVAAVVGVPLLLAAAFPQWLQWLVSDARALALGAFAGLLGACISVLQRSGSLVLTQFPSKAQIVVQAIVRILLGVVFGTLVVIAVKGNVAFGTFKGDMRALFLLAVAAAFSERLIPDLLSKLTETAHGSSANVPRK
jgi:hypothetical protein